MAVTPDDQAGLLDMVVEVAQKLAGPAVIIDESSSSAASAERLARLLAGIARHDVVVVPGSRLGRCRPKPRMLLRFARAPQGNFIGSNRVEPNRVEPQRRTSEPD